jgi:hypothetical protein
MTSILEQSSSGIALARTTSEHTEEVVSVAKGQFNINMHTNFSIQKIQNKITHKLFLILLIV